MKPLRNTRRIFFADSYFSSVTAVNDIEKIGLHFVGVVNADTKKYYMQFLNCNYLHEHGEYKKKSSIHEDDDSVSAVAIMWLNKDRKFLLVMLNLPLLKSPVIMLGGSRWRNRVIIWIRSWWRL